MKNSTQKENADLDRIWGFKDVCVPLLMVWRENERWRAERDEDRGTIIKSKGKGVIKQWANGARTMSNWRTDKN